MKTENWCGHDIRFIEFNKEWWAVLKDICNALNLSPSDMAKQLDPERILRIPGVLKDKKIIFAVNELGVYDLLFASDSIEARKFRHWNATVMKKLRRDVGLKEWEVMKMTEPKIQGEIDCIIDSIYYNEETGNIMRSITVAGGDVEQVIYE